MKNSNFKALVAKMDALQENEQGKLKGGVSTLNSTNASVKLKGGNFICPVSNKSECGVKETTSPTGPSA